MIFDLDDTLYPEMTFVRSGFRAVAEWGTSEFGLDADGSFHDLLDILNKEGRGKVFDIWLAGRNKKFVAKAVQVYRKHEPKIDLFPEAKKALRDLEVYPRYIVTDGNKNVQQSKVNALSLTQNFKKIYITHRYGLANAKPSVHCFSLIRHREACDWRDLIYIGDNPNKDFVNIKQKGARTIRVLTGVYKDLRLSKKLEADCSISSLSKLKEVL